MKHLSEKLVVYCFLLIITTSIGKELMRKKPPDIIFFNGKIVTVDKDISIARAVAITGDRFSAIGSDDDILTLADSGTIKIDLKGKTVLPGIIDAHLHPETASESELFETIPDVHTVDELLDWIKTQTRTKRPGEWIIHPKFFPTRLLEMRQPNIKELDQAAPAHPVFLNGTYGGMINSAAIKISKLDERIGHPGLLRDPDSGQLTGFIRASAFKLLKFPPGKKLSYDEHLDALEKMIERYNRVGITSICSGSGGPEQLKMYFDLKKQDRLTARVFQNFSVRFDFHRPTDEIRKKLESWGYYTGFGDEWVRVGALKVSMDGGILTGTAYLREPWGDRAKAIYGIADPQYRGVLLITEKELIPLVTAANDIGWKFTAHCTGGGGVDIMLNAFEQVNETKSVKDRRFSIIHGNFFTPESIEKMARLGVCADMQPAWFYKDADAMKYILGEDRIKTFHPYRSLFDGGVVVNGGSDHMAKFDSYAAINPYNPFLSMWTVISRKTERDAIIVPEQAISREQAIRMYTINNAYTSFEEDIKGSIEPGKLADLIVLSDDILHCPLDKIKEITVELTMVGGRIVFQRAH